MRYQYGISLKKEIEKAKLVEELKGVEGIKQIRLTINPQTNI
jgi:hypothetical protein